MKNINYIKLALAVFISLPFGKGWGWAQIYNASTITIQSGANLYFDGNTQNQSGGTLSNSGTVHVSGNFANTGTANIGGTVIFDGNATQSITGNTDFLNHIEVNNTGGTVTVASGQQNIHQYMKITNGTLNANNRINFLSAPTQTALIDGSGGGDVTGNVTFNRLILGGNGYRYFSAPVAGSTVADVMDDYSVVGVNGHPSQTFTNPWPTLWQYNETNTNTNSQYGWISYTSASNPLNTMMGYAGIMSATNLDFTGPVRNGNLSVPITNTPSGSPSADGWSLMGNPYPSPIDWQGVYALNNNLAATLYCWSSTGTYTGQYTTYNALTGIQTNGGSRHIASSQGIYIKCIASGNLLMNNSIRTTLLNPQFYKSDQSDRTLLRLEVTGNGHSDELVIYAEKDGLEGYSDEFDAFKIKAEDASLPTFFTIATDQSKLSINALPQFGENAIPVGFKAGKPGIYAIYATEQFNLTEGVQPILEDRKLNVKYNLSSGSYEFTQNPEDPDSGRFYLWFKEDSQPAAASTHLLVNLYSQENRVLLQIKGNQSHTFRYQIQSVNGQLITASPQYPITDSSFRIEGDGLAVGLYIVSVEVDGKIFNGKLLIK
jgi:hypothetical protein